MDNKLELVRLPDRMSGPRHGGARNERHWKFYVNGHLFGHFSDGAARPFDYATGNYLDKALDAHVAKFEAALGCKCLRVDMSRPEPKAVVNPNPRRDCEHDWRATDNWLIDKCAKCGEERA